MKTKRTNQDDQDFRNLVHKLDQELAIRDGDDHDFYHQFNSIDQLDQAILILSQEKAVACAAMKKFDHRTVEIKRMFVDKAHRGQGLAKRILAELEHWAKETGFERCVLETGKKQPEAIALYSGSGYKRMANYGPYKGVDNSLCFEKILNEEKGN